MERKMYYVDARTKELVKDLDVTILPPESYYQYITGVDGIVVETWSDGKNQLDFSWVTKRDLPMIAKERNQHFKDHDFNAIYLVSYAVPPEWFDEAIKKLYEDDEIGRRRRKKKRRNT